VDNIRFLRLPSCAYEQARAALPLTSPPVVPFSFMPTRLRRSLLALPLGTIAIGCAAAAPIATDRAAAIFSPGPSTLIERLQADPRRFASHRAAPPPTLGQRAATIAVKAVGVPYRWGGSSPTSGFDCSGLVYWTYGRLGIELPHSSYALYDLGRRIKRSQLEPGDVLFFSGLGHVGLYLGDGRMVHAPHSGRRVEVVRLGGSRYGQRLIGARRLADPV
jgi:cell wall-associated NlpC family hydrolase